MIETDILIVGGGFVGLSLALAMVDSGHRIIVLDQKAAPSASETKVTGAVIAVSPASADFLTDLGVWSRIPATPYVGMQVFDGTGTGDVSFDAMEIGRQNLGYIAAQADINRALVQALSERSNIDLRWSQNWTDLELVDTRSTLDRSALDRSALDRSRLVLESGEEIETTLLVGADGGSSRIREEVGLKSIGWDYQQNAVVCLARLEKLTIKLRASGLQPTGRLHCYHCRHQTRWL